MKILSELAECNESDIIGFDMNLVSARKPSLVGIRDEFLCSQKLDDSLCAFVTLKSFLEVDKPDSGLLALVVFDHEEISSGSDVGARSNLLSSVFRRLGVKPTFFSRSLLVSADCLHALHPNFPQYNEDCGLFCIGEGVMYGWNETKAFGTDNPELQRIKAIAAKAGVPFKPWVARNSIPSGSTIGCHILSQLGLPTVDFSLGVLGMHSISETLAVDDVRQMLILVAAVIRQYKDYQ
jgi:aspartyl aminopeptidase